MILCCNSFRLLYSNNNLKNGICNDEQMKLKPKLRLLRFNCSPTDHCILNEFILLLLLWFYIREETNTKHSPTSPIFKSIQCNGGWSPWIADLITVALFVFRCLQKSKGCDFHLPFFLFLVSLPFVFANSCVQLVWRKFTWSYTNCISSE